MLPASLEAVDALGAGDVMAPRVFSLPLPPLTRCLRPKTYAVGPQPPRVVEKVEQMKASALFGAGWEGDSVEVLWRDADRAFCRLWRNDAESETHAFIPIPSGADHSTLESVSRLTHEHELQSYLDGSWAVRPLELV